MGIFSSNLVSDRVNLKVGSTFFGYLMNRPLVVAAAMTAIIVSASQAMESFPETEKK